MFEAAAILGMIIPLTIIIIAAFIGGQVQCPHCGWYTQYTIFKPKYCSHCELHIVD